MDISPTILGVAGITDPNDSYSNGVNLLAGPPKQDRVRKTYVFAAPRVGAPALLQEYTIRKGKFEKDGTVTTVGESDHD